MCIIIETEAGKILQCFQLWFGLDFVILIKDRFVAAFPNKSRARTHIAHLLMAHVYVPILCAPIKFDILNHDGQGVVEVQFL